MTITPLSLKQERLLDTRFCDLGLRLSLVRYGIDTLFYELAKVGLTQIKPDFYVADEWGVPDGTCSVGVPFYLLREDLGELHEALGHEIEGGNYPDLMKFLRHETGHVVNYAYLLYREKTWADLFGDFDLPYPEGEEYEVDPDSTDFVRNIPTAPYYAQKHPDEDWSETFAVWLAGGVAQYAAREYRKAMMKLLYCDVEMTGIASEKELPLVVTYDDSGDLRGSEMTLREYYVTEKSP